jgi:hypothetical protein
MIRIFFIDPWLLRRLYSSQGQKCDKEYFIHEIFEGMNDECHHGAEYEITKMMKMQTENCRAHHALDAWEKIRRMKIKKLLHPPYSPNPSPCNFWFFGWAKIAFQDLSFTDTDVFIEALTNLFDNVTFAQLYHDFQNWIRRLKHVIHNNEEYFTEWWNTVLSGQTSSGDGWSGYDFLHPGYNLRWIPYQLDDDLRETRVGKCRELLQGLEPMKKLFFSNFVTGDESLIYHDYNHSAKWYIQGGSKVCDIPSHSTGEHPTEQAICAMTRHWWLLLNQINWWIIIVRILKIWKIEQKLRVRRSYWMKLKSIPAIEMFSISQTRQDKTRQNKTKQDKTRQNKTKQDKTR